MLLSHNGKNSLKKVLDPDPDTDDFHNFPNFMVNVSKHIMSGKIFTKTQSAVFT